MRRPRLIAAALGGLLAVVAAAPAAGDDFHFREYTFGSSSCTGIKDPVNLYFGGSLGTIGAATEALEDVAGLKVEPLATNQWFWDDGACQRQDEQRADAWAGARRRHARLNQGRWIDPQFTHITAAPVHQDVWTWCGDVAESFNAPRNLVAQRIQARAGWYAVYSWTGNTLAIRQCDGRYTAGDGYYVLARD